MKLPRLNINKFWLSMIIISIITLVYVSLVYSDYIFVNNGHIFSLLLNTNMDTYKWGGVKGHISPSSVTLSLAPFYSRYILSSSDIYEEYIPGGNLDQSRYNLLVMALNTTINLNNVMSTNQSDLQPGVLFASSMYGGVDAPNRTFNCTGLINFSLGGEVYQACHATLRNGLNYGILKYNNSGNFTALFIIDTSSYNCYDSSTCNYELLLPINTTQKYYYYYVSKYPEYTIRTWIDGVSSDTFSQTALPYYLKIQVLNYYTGNPISNITCGAIEQNGNNIFFPLRLSGFVSKAQAYAKTDSNGTAEFIIAPTRYQVLSNYSIKAVVISGNDIVKEKELSIQNYGYLVQQKKYLTPTSLLDHTKINVNDMESVVNSLYVWANSVQGSDSPNPEARSLTVTVYNNGSYVLSDNTLQTGAPNVITVYLRDASNNNLLDGYVKIEENEGYLVFNPTYDAYTSYQSNHTSYQTIETGREFIVTPTSYGLANSNIVMHVYDSSMSQIATISFTINTHLEPRTGVYYNNDDLKVIINSIESVLNSLYYSLN